MAPGGGGPRGGPHRGSPGPATALLVLLLTGWAQRSAGTLSKPGCHVQVRASGQTLSQACGYIEHSDACCLEPLVTQPVRGHTKHGAHHSNVTFSALVNDALYLVSHDGACGPAHECWEVSPGPMGPMGPLGAAGAAGAPGSPADVLVSFLAGPKAYNVTMTAATVSRRAGDAAGEAASASGTESADCKLLRGSTPVLDISSGQDATLKLVPPQGVDGGAGGGATSLPSVCVTLHSDQCRVDCRDFTVPPHCRRGRFYQSTHCVSKLFDSPLTIRNVTRFSPIVSDPSYAALVNATAGAGGLGGPGGPLLYHCARLQLGGCVLATQTVAARVSPPSAPVEVAVQAHDWTRWSYPLQLLVFVVLPVCLCCFTILVVHSFSKTLPAEMSSPALSLSDRSNAEGEAGPRRLFLLYCRPFVMEGSRDRALVGAVRALARVLSASGRIEVVDMYKDPLLMEEGAVLRASSVVNDEDASLVVLVTPEAVHLDEVADLNLFHRHYCAVLHCLSHAPRRLSGRLFFVCLDARHRTASLHGLPVTALYVLPFHLADLLSAMAGSSARDAPRKQIVQLQEYIKEYTSAANQEDIVQV